MENSNINKQAILNYLNSGKRFDGRKELEYRDLTIETPVSNKAEGSARVKLGNTEVVAGIKMSLGEPYPDSQDKGNLSVTAEFTPMSNSDYEPGPPQIDSIELARIIDRGVRESGFIDLKKLCVKGGELVWNMFIDIYSENADGNLLDAAAIAVIAALKTAKVPKIENDKVLFGEWTEHNVPLTEMMPLVVTFHKIGGKMILDPTYLEEEVSTGRITIGVSVGKQERIHSMQKGKEEPMSAEEVEFCVDEAFKKAKELKTKIDKLLK